jgi:DNA-binding response OmpR family regulator
MLAISIRVLHVADDPAHRTAVARHLSQVEGMTCDVLIAESCERAMHVFTTTQIDLVMVECALADGEGLSCLRYLRQLDAFLPIIALSATVADELAAELIEAGADDHLHHDRLDGHILGRSLRSALARAHGIRSRRAAAVAAIG